METRFTDGGRAAPMSFARATARRWLGVVAVLCALALAAPAARAETVDRMGDASGFFNETPVCDVESEGWKVTVSKTGPGDAFCRWGVDGKLWTNLTPDNDVLEMDLSGFPDGGAVSAQIAFLDKDGQWKGAEWIGNSSTLGRVTVPSLKQFAADHDIEDPRAFHLLLRVATDPQGGFTIDRIRLGAAPDPTPMEMNKSGEDAGASAAPQGGKAAADAVGATGAPAGLNVVGVVFDKQALEYGMTVDPSSAKPTTVKVDGKDEACWVAERPMGSDGQYLRSFRFDVTDPTFVDGGRPAVDVEITYMLNTWAGVDTTMATEGGAEKVDQAWGDSKNKWKTEKFTVDAAAFDGSIDGKYDLKISGANVPLYVKRVRLIGYDTKRDVDWGRLLKVVKTEAVGSIGDGLFVFRDGDSGAGVTYELTNLADVAAPITYNFRVRGQDGTLKFEKSDTVEVAPSGTSPVTVNFDPAGWALGPYTATLEATIGDKPQSSAPDVQRDTLMGVVTDAKLEKAREGEFMYGMDTGDNPRAPDALAFLTLMGVDILRFPGINPAADGAEREALEALDQLDAVNIKSAIMVMPPGQITAVPEGQFDAELDKVCANLESLARATQGRFKYWELGNEPDLPFFFPGPIDLYVKAYERMVDSLKKGDPEALAMNGGLCFWSSEGERRAFEFIEKVDPTKVDVWAYHAHGPGIGPERHRYGQIRAGAEKAVEKAGAGNLVFLDTETGASALSPEQFQEQARTVVEKMAFAQAEGMPTLMFFRMNMRNEGWALVENRTEPRPVVLAYRSVVERLRHHAYVKSIDTGAPGVDAFLFRREGDNQKVLVTWSNEPARRSVNLRLDDAGADVGTPMVYDLYGNATPASVIPGGVATLAVDVDPTYLVWTSPGDASAVDAAPAALAADPGAVVAGQANPVVLKVRNASNEPIDATVTLDPHGRLPVEVDPTTASFTLAAGEEKTVPLTVTVGASDAPLAMPTWWRVFTDVDDAAFQKMSPAERAKFPDALPGAPSYRDVAAPANRVDLGKLAGGALKERRPAVLYATIDSPTETTMPATASADYWMAWYANGEEVYSTIETRGNSSKALHKFDLPLKKGRNVLAVLVQSGSGGFAISYGGPKELAMAESRGINPDRLDATLTVGGKAVAEEAIPLPIVAPLPAMGDLSPDAPLSEWVKVEPLAALGEADVVNPFLPQPDSSKWYKGESDLSAVAWLRDGGDALHLVVAVRDDALKAGATPADLAGSDAVRLVLADEAGHARRRRDRRPERGRRRRRRAGRVAGEGDGRAPGKGDDRRRRRADNGLPPDGPEVVARRRVAVEPGGVRPRRRLRQADAQPRRRAVAGEGRAVRRGEVGVSAARAV